MIIGKKGHPSRGAMEVVQYFFLQKDWPTNQLTDRPTDLPIDQLTNQPTDRKSYL